MGLRWKVALAMAVIASVATVAVGIANYRSTESRLVAEVDRSLLTFDRPFVDRGVGLDRRLPERGPLAGFEAQLVAPDGSVFQSTLDPPLPVGRVERSVIGVVSVTVLTTVDSDAGLYRVRTVGADKGAVQLARSLDEAERVLDVLRGRILLWTAIVVLGSIIAGWLIAGRVTASLRRLTRAAEHVEATGRLDVSIAEDGHDEVGRLGAAFDRMLATLRRSRDEQRRLVEDAGHELRTPLTSLRTNVELLERYPSMDPTERDAVLADLRAETGELTELVNEIVAVAAGEHSDEPFETVDLAEVAAEVAERFERRTGRRIEVRGTSEPVTGRTASIHRAISCLVDNACKFDRGDEPVTVEITQRAVTVCDHGPGIPAADLERVFERFHRADDVRAMPGSGLGLAIVRDVARVHGGEVTATSPAGGGACVGFCVAAEPPGSKHTGRRSYPDLNDTGHRSHR